MHKTCIETHPECVPAVYTEPDDAVLVLDHSILLQRCDLNREELFFLYQVYHLEELHAALVIT